jgi:uncharacterized Zn finger protein
MNQNNMFSQISNIIPGLIPNYCDRCGIKHEKEDLELINQDREKAVYNLRCSSCGTKYIIQVNSPTDGVVAAKRTPFKSDITSDEFSKFSASKKIDDNEILDVYTSLEEVTTINDFNLLFSERNPQKRI